MTIKIALASSPVLTRDVHHNMASILQTIEKCRGKADLVLFGEAVLQGFDCLTWEYEEDCKMAVSLHDHIILQICQAAKKNHMAVSFGYIEKAGAWNDCIKHGYAGQAALCGDHVLLVNPFCADSCKADCAAGGAVYFKSGAIAEERLLGPVVF